MKVGQVNQATAASLELKKFDERIRLKKQELDTLKKQQYEVEKTASKTLDKGTVIDKKV